MSRGVSWLVLALGLLIAQGACNSGAANPDGSTGSAGSSGGAGGNAVGGAGGTAAGGSGGTSGGGRGGGGATTDGGGTDAPATYACGSGTCMTGQTLCYSYAPGTPGGGPPSRSCTPIPAACAGNPTCACVCPPFGSPPIGCRYVGGAGGSCTCSETDGLTVSCAGQ
jgi:hypothetical protein